MTSMNTNNGDSQTSPNHDANGQKPDDDRKLFVGGLSWDTTTEDLREYFSSFGTITDCSIKHDPTTGRSRGFAFLVFDRKDIVDQILSQTEHFVKGRKVDPKPAHRRAGLSNLSHQTYHMSSSTSSSSISNNNRKVFIGGLDPNFPDVQLREYFSQFGPIDEIDLPYDKEKNERRPFCFISFQNEQSAQEVLRLQRHTIGDITVDVKRAKPKTLNNQQQQQLYDPYGQQSLYANYGPAVPSYGVNAYSAADPYAAWNGYPYNPQGNPGGYSYASSDPTAHANSAPSAYPQYSQHQSNSSYSYGPSNPNEYYSHYGYGAPSHGTSNIYADPNVYAGNSGSGSSSGGGGGGGSGGGGYDYNSYYQGGNVPVGDSGNVPQESNSSNDNNIYEHDNHYGKGKAAIVTSPNYHTYSIT